MVGSVFDKVAGYLDKRFALVAFFPCLVFTAAWLALVASDEGWSRTLKWWLHRKPEVKTVLALGGLVALVFAASLLSVQLETIAKVHEGYWGSARIGTILAWPARRFRLWRFRRLDRKIGECSDDAYEFKYRNYPRDEVDVLPTRLGNVLRAAELYPADPHRYGIQAVFFWPRLYAVLPDNFRADLDNARASMDLMLIISTLGLAFSAGAPIYLGLVHVGWITWVAAVAGPFLLARLGYYGAVRAAVPYGELIRSAFDLHRGTLLKQLGYAAPRSREEEVAVWKALGQVLYRRGADDEEVLRFAAGAEADKGASHPLCEWLVGLFKRL